MEPEAIGQKLVPCANRLYRLGWNAWLQRSGAVPTSTITDMRFPINQRTGSLAQRVREDFRLLSADTKHLLRQALTDELPAARQRIMRRASDGLDRSRAWLVSNSRTIKQDQRTPYVLGAIGVAALAVAYLAWMKFANGGGTNGKLVAFDDIPVEED